MRTFTLVAVVALLLALALSTSQVQGSGLDFDERELYRDECIVRHFGVTASKDALTSVLNQASLSDLVDAFIDCPRQMCYVFTGRPAYSEFDDLVLFVRDSDKTSQFYTALRSVTRSGRLSICDSTRRSIYITSFVFDIPPEYFLDELKKDSLAYFRAVTEKAMICKTPESKNWITGLLNEMIVEHEQISPAKADASTEYFINFLNMCVKLMSNEELNIIVEDNTVMSGIILHALNFERYDVAERLIDHYHCSPLALEDIIFFSNERPVKYIIDRPRAFSILRRLLSSDEDRAGFDELFNNI